MSSVLHHGMSRSLPSSVHPICELCTTATFLLQQIIEHLMQFHHLCLGARHFLYHLQPAGLGLAHLILLLSRSFLQCKCSVAREEGRRAVLELLSNLHIKDGRAE